MLQSGVIRFYELKIVGVDVAYNYQVHWMVTSGQIVSGQGTNTVGITETDDGQTVSAEIEGMPPGCPNITSETVIRERAGRPIKLAQFNWPLKKDYGTFRDIAKAADNSPSSQLLIFTPPDDQIHKAFADRIRTALPERKIDPAQLTFLDTSGRTPLIQVWLVPPGANMPDECVECETVIEPGPNGRKRMRN